MTETLPCEKELVWLTEREKVQCGDVWQRIIAVKAGAGQRPEKQQQRAMKGKDFDIKEYNIKTHFLLHLEGGRLFGR